MLAVIRLLEAAAALRVWHAEALCGAGVVTSAQQTHWSADPDSKTAVSAQAIQGVPKLTSGLNPATWMLQISTPGVPAALLASTCHALASHLLLLPSCAVVK